MAIGVSFTNAAQRAVISNLQYGVAFIGNATFTGERKPFSYFSDAFEPIAGSGDPYYVYRINSVYPPMAFIQLLSPQRFAICSILKVGANTWEIVVSGSVWTVTPRVKCFSRLVGQGVSGLLGLRIRDNAGNRTWDSTEKMLVIRRKLDWASFRNTSKGGAVQTQALTGIASPYLMSSAVPGRSGENGAKVSNDARFSITAYSPGWTYSDGEIARLSRATTSFVYRDDNNPGWNSFPEERCYIINGDDY